MTTLIRWLLSCLIFFMASCKNSDGYRSYVPTKADSVMRSVVIKRAYKQIEILKTTVQNGDIITRTGNDFTSESLRKLNQRDQTYSHCGIVSIEHDTVFVYHALGGDFNPDQKIRRDQFEVFAEPYDNKGIGIYRFAVADSIKQEVVSVSKEYFSHGIMFDMNFDLTTDDRMYCAEFVYKTLLKASGNKLIFNHSHIKQFEFIGVDDILLQPQCKLQAQLVYK